MEIVITAGEASGDLFGAELARALRALSPGVMVSGLGGPRMRRAGVELLRDTSTWGAIGVVNALKIVPRALEGFSALRAHLRSRPPAVMVPIDFGAFNVKAGRMARGLGVPVYYFIAPGSWRKEGPINPRLLECADVFCTQLPWHAERLRLAGARSEFYGHPLLDLAHPSAPAADLRRQWGLAPDTPVVCLLPGSRRHEIEHILPPLLGAGERIQNALPGTACVLGLAEVVDPGQVARILAAQGWSSRAVPRDRWESQESGRMGEWENGRMGEGGSRQTAGRGAAAQAGAADEPGPSAGASPTPPLPHSPTLPLSHTPTREALVATGRTYDCLAVSNAALCASGTVTLEAAILGVPQVITYTGGLGMRVQYWFVKGRIKYVGLPNLLLDAPACPELLADAATPERIAAAAIPLLGETPEARAQMEAFRQLQGVLGEPGAIREAAGRILEIGMARRK